MNLYGIIGFKIVDTDNFGRTMMMGANPAQKEGSDYNYNRNEYYTYSLSSCYETLHILIPNFEPFYSKYARCLNNGQVTYLNLNEFVLKHEKVNGLPTLLYVHKLYFEPFNRIDNPWLYQERFSRDYSYLWNTELTYEEYLREETSDYYDRDPEAWESFIKTMKKFPPRNIE